MTALSQFPTQILARGGRSKTGETRSNVISCWLATRSRTIDFQILLQLLLSLMAARSMRSIRCPAAGEGGTSARRTAIMGGADSSSATGIAVNMRFANGVNVHCAGAIAKRSECARQVNSVSAD